MRTLTLWQIELLPWYAVMIVWGVAALKVKRDKVVEPPSTRLFHIVFIALAFVLLFSQSLPLGPLRQRFVPPADWLRWSGIVLTCMGAAVAIWARLNLGENWSARVIVKQGHQLISSGPYAYVRHPIYSGFLLAVVGTAIEIGEWRGLGAIVLVAVTQSLKAQREEKFMLSEFGERYAQYQKQTGFLVPKL